MNAVDSSRMPGDNEHPKQTEGGALNLAEVWGEIESQRFAEEFDLDDQEISLLNRGILRIIKSSERTRNREVFNSYEISRAAFQHLNYGAVNYYYKHLRNLDISFEEFRKVMIASESKIKFSQQLKDELVETDPNFKDIFESDSPIEAYLTSKDIKIDSDDSWMLSSFNDSDENVIRNLAVYNIYGANLSKIYDWVDAKEEDMPSLIYNIQEKIFSDQENNTDEPEAKGISRQDLVILGAQAHLTWLCNELWRNIDTLSKRYLGDGKEFRRQMLASYLDMIGEAKATETLDDDYVLAVDFVQILARRDYDNFNSKYEA